MEHDAAGHAQPAVFPCLRHGQVLVGRQRVRELVEHECGLVAEDAETVRPQPGGYEVFVFARGELGEPEDGAAVVSAGVALERLPRFSPWLALAASVLLLVGGVTLWRTAGLRDDVLRGGDDRVTLVAPIGTVPAAAAERLVWRAVPGATSFEIEVIDGGGAVVFGAGTPDTTATVPSGTLRLGVEYRWRVTAVLTNGTRRPSAAAPLVISRP